LRCCVLLLACCCWSCVELYRLPCAAGSACCLFFISQVNHLRLKLMVASGAGTDVSDIPLHCSSYRSPRWRRALLRGLDVVSGEFHAIVAVSARCHRSRQVDCYGGETVLRGWTLVRDQLHAIVQISLLLHCSRQSIARLGTWND
jgi:hypothetical protein